MAMIDEADLDAAGALAEYLADQDAGFLEALVAHRSAAGFTQADLAAAWGRHKTAVSQFEQPGNDPRLSTIRRYAASIGVRYQHVLTFDSDVHRPSPDTPVTTAKTTYSDVDVWSRPSAGTAS